MKQSDRFQHFHGKQFQQLKSIYGAHAIWEILHYTVIQCILKDRLLKQIKGTLWLQLNIGLINPGLQEGHKLPGFVPQLEWHHDREIVGAAAAL
ncbi:hypothetical protein FRX31_028855 [Thalictrum thalictroides]|uniref:Uncharacterized protein n=1 Tax=Thalictrum thalictroides TaxID=46969 RepID=A0A7J6V952_THATH|nr:hypothetical protein FRX31_028855 [Thalictrum thalictroides]